ncbi:hypothetical protein RIF29_08012 [Crotalaria pallida]|uniref:Uncharacterized protein n=1 Tax=Crotalaria pallida TaxID=3830 RepID=A0AAN9PB42_CROPI
MTLLEIIKNASANPKSLDLPSNYPIVLNPHNIIPDLESDPFESSLIGWQISPRDVEIVDLAKKFFALLKTMLDDTNDLDKAEFIDVAALVLDGCIALEIWKLVEALIVNGVIGHSCYPNLVARLVEKKRSNLLCLCIKYAIDLGSSEILSILRYFLSPSKGAYKTMMTVKKE